MPARRFPFTFLLLLTLPAAPTLASAQETEGEAPADVESPAEPSSAVVEARTRVERGEALFERGDYDAALTEFETAYEVIGEHPNRYLVLYNIAQCHEREFRYDVALRYYQRYLDEGGNAAEDRAAVTQRIHELEELLATVQVDTNVGSAVVWLDEREAGTAPGEVRIPAGVHVIELRSEGYLPARREVQVAAGGSTEVQVHLEKLSEEFEGLSPVFFWSAAGVALASLITGIVLGVSAVDARGSVQTRLDDPRARWDVTQGEIDHISTLATVADVFYAGAALFGITAVVMGLLTDWGSDEEEPPVTPSVAIGRGAAEVSLSGSF